MKLDDMLAPGANIPVDKDHMLALVQEVNRLRSECDAGFSGLYAFVAALAHKLGGKAEVCPDEWLHALGLDVEMFDKADGTIVARIIQVMRPLH